MEEQTPLPDQPQPIPAVPTEPPNQPIRKQSFWILLGIILTLLVVVMFSPIPTYLPEPLTCKPGQTCLAGWHLNPSLFQSLVGSYYAGRVQIAPTAPLTPTSSPDPAANWKTYLNNTYMFSLKYPNDWGGGSVDDTRGGLIATFSKDGIVIGINRFLGSSLPTGYTNVLDWFDDLKSKKQKAIEPNDGYYYGPGSGNFYKWYMYYKLDNIKEFAVNQYSAIITSNINTGVSYIVIPHSLYIYQITLQPIGANDNSVIQQILSTFQFTNQNQTTDISTWNTYKDSKLHIEFKYPDYLVYKDLRNGVISFSDNQNKTKFNFSGFSALSTAGYQDHLQQRKNNGPILDQKTFTDSQNRVWQTDMALGEVYNFTGTLNQQGTYYIVSLQSGFDEEADNGNSFRNFANQILSSFKFTN